MKMKKGCALVVSTVLLCSLELSAFAAAPKFSDVPADFWAHQAIQTAVETSVTNGYQDGTFRPADKVTNAHFGAFIARAFYASEISTYLSDPWYASYTNVLAKHGIPKNTTLAGNFPKYIDQPINRYDMAMVLYNVLRDKQGELPTQQELTAAQQSIGDWASIPQKYQPAVAACYALGLLNGQADGTFGGSNLMNRAQACVVINRLSILISATSDKTEPPSVPDRPQQNQPTETLQPGQYDVNVHYVPADTNRDGFITEEEVQAVLARLREEYPEDTPWGADQTYTSTAFHANGSGCAAWAFFVSDQIFGKTLPVTSTRHVRSRADAANFRMGDVRESNSPHWAIYTSNGVNEDGIFTECDGNVGKGVVSWADHCTLAELSEEGLANDTYDYVYYSRYPQ